MTIKTSMRQSLFALLTLILPSFLYAEEEIYPGGKWWRFRSWEIGEWLKVPVETVRAAISGEFHLVAAETMVVTPHSYSGSLGKPSSARISLACSRVTS